MEENQEVKQAKAVAEGYAIEHEDRLISGVCMPKASPLYLNILECVTRINWHIMRAIVSILPPPGRRGEITVISWVVREG